MKDYKSYSKRSIKKDIKELEKIRDTICENIDESEELFTDLNTANTINDYINYLEALNDNGPQIEETFEEREESIYDALVEDLDEIEEYIEYVEPIKDFLVNGITHFVDTPYYKEYMNFTKPKDIRLKNSEIVELIHDFYQTLPDKEIKGLFNKAFSNIDSNYRIMGDETNTLVLPFVNSYYINIAANTSSTRKIISSIHEYGHVIDYGIREQVDGDYTSSYPFVELPSLLFESLAGDYLKKELPNAKSQIKEEELSRLVGFLHASNILMTEYAGYEQKKLNNPLKYAYLLRKYGSEELEDIQVNPALRTFNYVVPYLTSIELQEKYKKDPEKTLYLLKTIIKANDEENYLSYLESKDIILNNNSSKFIQKKRTLK